MATDRLLDSFHTAREWGFHDIAEKPKPGEPQIHQRGMNNFKKAIERGVIPPCDVWRGALPMWRTSTVVAYQSGQWVSGKPRRKSPNTAAAKPKRQPGHHKNSART